MKRARTDEQTIIVSATSSGATTEIWFFNGEGDVLAMYELPRSLLDVDALAARFAPPAVV